jgi:beta-galactosidase
MDIHAALKTFPGIFGHAGDVDTWKKIFHEWKDVGINTANHRWSIIVDDDPIFQAADEVGFFISLDAETIQLGDPDKLSIPEYFQYLKNRNRSLIVPKRQSPSLVFYYAGVNSSSWDYHPAKLGEDFDTEQLVGKTNAPERKMMNEIDPDRISFCCSGGGKFEPVHSSMNYIHIDADLQVHETWPSRWYKYKKKPLATYEMAAPPYIADWFMRRSRGEQAFSVKGVMPYWLEVSAIYLGEEPYLTEPKENVKKWLSVIGTDKNQNFQAYAKCYDEVAKLFTRNVFRTWRTYGVNMGLFTQVRYYRQPKPFFVKPIDSDVRTPGIRPDQTISINGMLSDGENNELGKIAKAALGPMVAYIGGPDGQFTSKDHTFWAGEKVKKALVLINNYQSPVIVKGIEWRLDDSSGKTVSSGRIPAITLAPGEIATDKTQIELTAPSVKTRQTYTLFAKVDAVEHGTFEDRFELTAYPKPAQPKIPANMNIILYDPIGDTGKMLSKAGVKFQTLSGTLPDPENGLLIIGRNALKSKQDFMNFTKVYYTKMNYDFTSNVSNGMKVLMFEQASDNVCGLKTEQTRWRRAFISAMGHPVFDGLGKDDFIYLRGESDLVESYPDSAKPGTTRVCSDRFPEWGNDNVVTSYTYIRPQVGANRSLLVSGFDLQETPLFEAVGGKGRLMFCQVDVTNRYGNDPVSTILVNNMLSYMSTATAPAMNIGNPVDLVREGSEDYNVKVKKEEVIIADRPEGPISWGVPMSDLYFEELLNIPVIQGENDRKYLYAQPKGAKTIVHTLNRQGFKTNWQKMKVMMIRSALLINQGGSSEIFPNPSLQGNNEELYPLEWVQGFVHPYLMMQW